MRILGISTVGRGSAVALLDEKSILFAIEDLNKKGRLKRFTVICDHQSVVSEATKETSETSKNPWMNELRKVLGQNRKSIRLEGLESNPAHGSLTEFVNKQEPPA